MLASRRVPPGSRRQYQHERRSATAAALPWLSDDGLLAFAQLQETNAPPNCSVLSAPQFATLEVLVEAIIPTDERSPGAKEARWPITSICC